MPAEAQRPVVLAVDDSTDLLALMAKALGTEYAVRTAEAGAAALKLALAKPRPALILLDVEMPGESGFDVCRALKANPQTAGIPVIFLTGKSEARFEAQGFEIGAADYVTKPINVAVLRARVRAQISLADQRHALERLVQERTAALENARVQLLHRLARAMELHESAAVGNRVMRLGQYAKLIAQAAGAELAVAELLLKAAPLHDVGKLGIPSEILRKTDALSAPDWERIRRHPELGAEIIGKHDDPLLALARTIALSHHERWDGRGYPRGLKGEAIPWAARVVAIADTFESMTTTQFWRETRGIDVAVKEIVEGAGTAYDPELVKAFQKALPLLKKVRQTYSDKLGDMLNLDFSAAVPAEAPAGKVARR
jgi:putative two-component system response regulator